MGYRWIDHTAELELWLDCPTEAAVFEDALAALAELVGQGEAGDRVRFDVAIRAPDQAALLAAGSTSSCTSPRPRISSPSAVERLDARRRRARGDVCAVRGDPRHLVKGVDLPPSGVRARRRGLPGDGGARCLSARAVGARLRQVDEHAVGDPGGRACRHARAGAGVRRRASCSAQIAGDRSLEQLQNVATLPGHRRGGAGDAGHPRGLRLPGRRRRRDRAARRRRLAGRRRLRHQLRRAAARAAARPPPSSVAAPRRSCTRSRAACRSAPATAARCGSPARRSTAC